MPRAPLRIAAPTAALILAAQVGGKAFRDATYLSAWPVETLPIVAACSAVFVVILVQVFGRVTARYEAGAVVAGGFVLSAGAHAAEWLLLDSGRWVAFAIYVHLSTLGGVLLSAFWSLIAERFDPTSARASYGRIAAAGTAGGLAGGLAVARLAAIASPGDVLIMQLALQLLCAGGILLLRAAPPLFQVDARAARPAASAIREAIGSQYLRTIGVFAITTSAATAVLDYVFKANTRAAVGTGPELLRTFALFYAAVQVLSFAAQLLVSKSRPDKDVRNALRALPLGTAIAAGIGLLLPGWPMLAVARGTESLLRTTIFRNGYELLFLPMEATARNRTKPVIDVICDRIGEMCGSLIVQVTLLAAIASTPPLLTVVVGMAAASFWLGRRFNLLYLDAVEKQLVQHSDHQAQVSLVSEAGWTVLQLPAFVASAGLAEPSRVTKTDAPLVDPASDTLADLRSRDLTRVIAALTRANPVDRLHVAQMISLLAWDEALPATRPVLERVAPHHVGMLVDALLDPATDFTVRRRLPRILGIVPTRRSLDGLVSGLGDSRFEVRYHCSRAINRILAADAALGVDRDVVIGAIDRELSAPSERRAGYRLLDLPEQAATVSSLEERSRFLEYVLSLLSTMIAREPLDAAVHGIHSPHLGVRGLALEYLDQVLPPGLHDRIKALILATSSGGDVP